MPNYSELDRLGGSPIIELSNNQIIAAIEQRSAYILEELLETEMMVFKMLLDHLKSHLSSGYIQQHQYEQLHNLIYTTYLFKEVESREKFIEQLQLKRQALMEDSFIDEQSYESALRNYQILSRRLAQAPEPSPENIHRLGLELDRAKRTVMSDPLLKAVYVDLLLKAYNLTTGLQSEHTSRATRNRDASTRIAQ